jgi:hypothetical protein
MCCWWGGPYIARVSATSAAGYMTATAVSVVLLPATFAGTTVGWDTSCACCCSCTA